MELFAQNKYYKWYTNIVNGAKQRALLDCYIERHHVVPKSLGGSNNSDNLVNLTAREHFICHMLLVKFTSGKSKQKMAWALWRLANPRKGCNKIKSKQYDIARRAFSEQIKISNSRPLSAKHKQALRGPRPNFIQTGKHNNNFKGAYVTPWGIFDSVSEASDLSPINMSVSCIIRYCKYVNGEKVKYKNKHNLVVGKTPFEQGFSFKSVEEL